MTSTSASISACVRVEPLVAHGRGSRNAQAAGVVLGGAGIGDGFLDILDGDQTDAFACIVDHQQLFDPALMKEAAGFLLPGTQRHSCEVFGRHQFANRLVRVLGETDIAVGEDTDQLAALVRDGNAADAVERHQFLRLPQRGAGRDGDRIDHHAAFEALHRAHGSALLVDFQIAVEDADPA